MNTTDTQNQEALEVACLLLSERCDGLERVVDAVCIGDDGRQALAQRSDVIKDLECGRSLTRADARARVSTSKQITMSHTPVGTGLNCNRGSESQSLRATP
jgi:hypothetical protein